MDRNKLSIIVEINVITCIRRRCKYVITFLIFLLTQASTRLEGATSGIYVFLQLIILLAVATIMIITVLCTQAGMMLFEYAARLFQ